MIQFLIDDNKNYWEGVYSRTVLRESLVLDNEEKIGLMAHKDDFDEYFTQFTYCLKLHLSFLNTGFILRLPDEDVIRKSLTPSFAVKQIAW